MIEQVKDNFTLIPNRIIDDNEVSDRAKAVYVKMRRCGTDWTFSIRGLIKRKPLEEYLYKSYSI